MLCFWCLLIASTTIQYCFYGVALQAIVLLGVGRWASASSRHLSSLCMLWDDQLIHKGVYYEIYILVPLLWFGFSIQCFGGMLTVNVTRLASMVSFGLSSLSHTLPITYLHIKSTYLVVHR